MDRQTLLKTEDLFHKVLAQAKQRPPSEIWGLCVSGGVDSICLLHVMIQVARTLRRPLVVFHVHHGPSENSRQSLYRDEVYRLVREICLEEGLPFLSNGDEIAESDVRPKSSSEGDLRDFRWSTLRAFEGKTEGPLTWLTAHHRDDVLETRLLQLIRGIGPEAVTHFRESDERMWRPFFQVAKKDLQDLAARCGWNFSEDPSNEETDSLRNWLRREWLPLLEDKRAGSLRSLHRSLDLLVQDLSSTKDQFAVKTPLPRADFSAFTLQRQRSCVVEILKSLGVFCYTKGQVDEIVKRLNSDFSVSFCVCNVLWSTDKNHIKASREFRPRPLKSH